MFRASWTLEERAEESGRDQAADEFFPDEKPDTYRELRRRGRGYAQGSRYNLHGRKARLFSCLWAQGYLSEWWLWKRCEDHPDER